MMMLKLEGVVPYVHRFFRGRGILRRRVFYCHRSIAAADYPGGSKEAFPDPCICWRARFFHISIGPPYSYY